MTFIQKKKKKIQKTDSRMVASRSVGRGNVELVYLTPLNCALKDAKVYIKYISPLLSPQIFFKEH